MYASAGHAKDIHYQTLKNSGTEPTDLPSTAGRGRRNTSREATYA
ncbi:MAG: hypothetical protein ACRC2T_19475 [Thermoguttaceae bacterium]